MLGCVEECRQRYGVNVIIDTVHGANTAKIRGYRMNNNSFYGSLKEVPAYKLRQIMNYLQMEGYLALTNDEYAIVKLTEKSAAVIGGQETISMKMAKEQEHPAKVRSDKRKKNGKGLSMPGREFSQEEELLFEKLRALRMEIAREEKVPPYIVFSDKSLTHMCMVKPTDRAEMLTVSGVGEYKYEKYGERFLACISEALRA